MSSENGTGGVYRKVSEVREKLGAVPKTGHNDHFGYDYHEADVVMGELRPLLSEIGLVIVPHQVEIEDVAVETRSGNAFLTTVKHELEVVDVEDGSSFRFPVYGRGQDSGDKGPTKAYTMAFKYGVMKLFGIADSSTDPDAGATPKQNGSRESEGSDLECPDCGGPVWDNRDDEKAAANGGKRPNFKCKDTDGCDWASWDSYEEVYGADEVPNWKQPEVVKARNQLQVTLLKYTSEDRAGQIFRSYAKMRDDQPDDVREWVPSDYQRARKDWQENGKERLIETEEWIDSNLQGEMLDAVDEEVSGDAV